MPAAPLTLSPEDISTFPALLETIYAQRYSGQLVVVMHFQNGVPLATDVATPERIHFRGARGKSTDAAASPGA